MSSIIAQLKKLIELRDAGEITPEEFDQKQREILRTSSNPLGNNETRANFGEQTTILDKGNPGSFGTNSREDRNLSQRQTQAIKPSHEPQQNLPKQGLPGKTRLDAMQKEFPTEA